MHTTATYGHMHISNHGIGQCVLAMPPHPWDRETLTPRPTVGISNAL